MTTLVFGGLGHVGSWIVQGIAARGGEVAIFDMGTERIAGANYDYLHPHRDRIYLENVDVLDEHTLYQRMRAYEGNTDAVIFGIAAIAGPAFNSQPVRNIRINTLGFLNVIEASRALQVPKFINLSSGAVYGAHPGGPAEDTPFEATDLYAATKIANEVLAQQYAATYGMDVRTARLFAVYGPGKRPSQMYPFYQALFGPLEGMSSVSVPSGGDQAMDWTHVCDTAAGVIALMDAEGVAGRIFNISSGVAVPHSRVVEHVREIVGRDSNISLGPGSFINRGTPLDVTAARRDLNFAPRFADIRDGLRNYHEWLAQATA